MIIVSDKMMELLLYAAVMTPFYVAIVGSIDLDMDIAKKLGKKYGVQWYVDCPCFCGKTFKVMPWLATFAVLRALYHRRRCLLFAVKTRWRIYEDKGAYMSDLLWSEIGSAKGAEFYYRRNIQKWKLGYEEKD